VYRYYTSRNLVILFVASGIDYLNFDNLLFDRLRGRVGFLVVELVETPFRLCWCSLPTLMKTLPFLVLPTDTITYQQFV